MKNTNMENTKKVNQEDIEVRCGFDYIGAGHNGDYNPEDPSDEMLLRLYVGISRPIPGESFRQETTLIEGASVCTQFSTHNSFVVLGKALDYITDAVSKVLPTDAANEDADFSAVVRLTEKLSWMGPNNMDPLAAFAEG